MHINFCIIIVHHQGNNMVYGNSPGVGLVEALYDALKFNVLVSDSDGVDNSLMLVRLTLYIHVYVCKHDLTYAYSYAYLSHVCLELMIVAGLPQRSLWIHHS